MCGSVRLSVCTMILTIKLFFWAFIYTLLSSAEVVYSLLRLYVLCCILLSLFILCCILLLKLCVRAGYAGTRCPMRSDCRQFHYRQETSCHRHLFRCHHCSHYQVGLIWHIIDNGICQAVPLPARDIMPSSLLLLPSLFTLWSRFHMANYMWHLMAYGRQFYYWQEALCHSPHNCKHHSVDHSRW